jgi:RNA polymerase sigma-70 factor, ECF subfamily
MSDYLLCEMPAQRGSTGVVARKAWADFLCVAPGDCPHRERTIEDFTFVAGDLRSMIRDDIVALLPDLRAFSRFLCRERESADDLVQNTILSALDKQDQFEPGTNLKGWLFTIMRNRFYSDLRTQRRRPASIDSDTAPMLTAVDNPEATLALKELSSALFDLSPQSREALVLVGAGGFSYEEAAALCGCSVGTLKARVSRARKQLSGKLG